MATRGKRDGGAGSFFLVLGCLTVLGGTFVLGFVAGRGWPTIPFSLTRSGATERASKDKADRLRARAPEPTPTFTFYEALTAPLTSPSQAKPPKPARVEKTEPAPQPVPTPPVPSAAPPPVASVQTPPPAAKDDRFTVQFGAYETREPAETLRARLAAAGYDAYIVEGDGPGRTRFRVRAGAFATRQAAQAFAVRIAAEQSVSTFVTTRSP
jgi:cell division protein FtsN